MAIYRPTVRYPDVYKGYIDDVFEATTLDRNQIMRAALFHAALSESFHLLMRDYLKEGKELPKPEWRAEDQSIWLEGPAKQDVIRVEGRRPPVISQSKKNGKISVVIT